jgi:hypothetical protein
MRGEHIFLQGIGTMRIIYYYQTFTGLTPVLEHPEWVSQINLAAIHFGADETGQPYIHLNDHSPDDPIFESVWREIALAQKRGITVSLMVGGAGGAYQYFSQHFDRCYQLLVETLRKHNLQGADLDIEEEFSLENVQRLIKQLRTDFGPSFVITMAPVISSLQSDQPGMGGFSYKELVDSPVGPMIDWFHIQSYGSYRPIDYQQAVGNGYRPGQLVFGMLDSQFGSDNFSEALETIKALNKQYSDFGGCFVWEYFDAPPGGRGDPSQWAELIYQLVKPMGLIEWILSHF